MITVVGTIKIDGWRKDYFIRSIKSVKPIAHLLSWRLNIAGEKREDARDFVTEKWNNAQITIDDNKTCTYDLISEQLAPLSDDALVLPWVEDMWFVCPHVNMFLHILEKFIESNAEVMPVSHVLTAWEEQQSKPAVVSNRFYSEHLIDLDRQEALWKNDLGAYWTISVSSIFKAGLLRDVIEHQKKQLSLSCNPRGLELPPDAAKSFLTSRSFIRLVPHFHVFREVVGFHDLPSRCVLWQEACDMIDLRDHGGIFGGFPEEQC